MNMNIDWNNPRFDIYADAAETEATPSNESAPEAPVPPPVQETAPATPTNPSAVEVSQVIVEQARDFAKAKPFNLRIFASNMRIFLPLIHEERLQEKIQMIESVAQNLWETLKKENRSTQHGAEFKHITDIVVQLYVETKESDPAALEALSYQWIDALSSSYFARNATVDFSELDRFPELQIKSDLVARTLGLSGQLTDQQLTKVGRTSLQWGWALMSSITYQPASGRVPNPIFLTACINAVTGVLKTELGNQPLSDEAFKEKLLTAKHKIHVLKDVSLLSLAEEVGITSPRSEGPKISSKSRFQKPS